MRKIIQKNTRNKKAQIWAMDLSIALIIFIGVIFLFYRYSISFAPENPLVNKMIKEGGYVSNTLMSTGFPPNWNELNLNQTLAIGLLNDEEIMDLNKLNNFSQWVGDASGDKFANYTLSKKKINTRYEYYIQFYNGQAIAPFQPIGLAPTVNATQIIKIQRLVAYRDESGYINNTKLILELWTTQNA